MERICCICGKKKPENLNILGKLICSDCEWKIVCSRAHDKGYKDYIKSISQLGIFRHREIETGG